MTAVNNKDLNSQDSAGEVKYQHYNSARTSMRLIAKDGKRVTFVRGEFITCDPGIIEYLDSEILQGVPGITKGKLMTSEEADPMSSLRAKIIAEHEAKKEAQAIAAAKGEEQDFGKTKGASNLAPASTKQLAGNAAGSTSAGAGSS